MQSKFKMLRLLPIHAILWSHNFSPLFLMLLWTKTNPKSLHHAINFMELDLGIIRLKYRHQLTRSTSMTTKIVHFSHNDCITKTLVSKI